MTTMTAKVVDLDFCTAEYVDNGGGVGVMMTLVMTKVEWVDKREPNWFWLNFALLVALGTSLITLHSLFSFN